MKRMQPVRDEATYTGKPARAKAWATLESMEPMGVERHRVAAATEINRLVNCCVDLQFPIAGMHIGCQSLLMNDFPAQSRQRVALGRSQARAKIGFVFCG